MKKGLKIMLISLMILVILIVIALIIVKIRDEVKKINTYKQDVAQYLEDKYDEEFDIKYVRKGYKKDRYEAHFGTFVKDIKTIKEYVYIFSPKNDFLYDISCYIVYWYDIENKTYEIDEHLYNINGYDKILDDYNQKKEIKDSLEKSVSILLENDFEIYLDSLQSELSFSFMSIETSKSIEELALNDYEKLKKMYIEIVDLLKDKEFFVKIKTSTEDLIIHKDSIFEKEKIIESIVSSSKRKEEKKLVVKCVDKYYKNKYEVESSDYSNIITFNFEDTLYEMAEDSIKFTSMYNEIVNVLKDTDTKIELKSKNDFARLDITEESNAQTDIQLNHIIDYANEMKLQKALEKF